MGVFSDIKAIKDVQRIKNGEKGMLSISQITGLITNMYDASKNLDRDTYKKVYELFTELRKCNTKMEMGMDEYYKTAVDIIKRFDAIAPYEKYSGGNELEFSFFMDDIRNDYSNSTEKNTELQNAKNNEVESIQTNSSVENLEKLYDEAQKSFKNKDYDKAKKYFEEYVNIVEEKIKAEYGDKRVYTCNNLEFCMIVNDKNNFKDGISTEYLLNEVYTALAYILVEEHNIDEAEKALKKALYWNPACVDAYNELAEVYKLKNDNKGFYDILQDTYPYIYKKEDMARYYRNMGYYNVEIENWDMAVKYYSYSLVFVKQDTVINQLSNLYPKVNMEGNDDINKISEYFQKNNIPVYYYNVNIEIIGSIIKQASDQGYGNKPFIQYLISIYKDYNFRIYDLNAKYSDNLCVSRGGKSALKDNNSEEFNNIDVENNNKTENTKINEKEIPDILKKYKELLDGGIITEEEFIKKKKELLNL